jgi:transposase
MVFDGKPPNMCPAAKGGAPVTPGLPEVADAERIVQILRAGGSVDAAIAAVGVPLATFEDWMQRGEPTRRARANASFREFRERVERAQGESDALGVARIAQAATTQWQAAAWLLEHRGRARVAAHNRELVQRAQELTMETSP